MVLLSSDPASSFSLSLSLLQLQLPPPMGAGLYDGFFFLLLKLLAQVLACPTPFAWSLPKGVGAKRPECGLVMKAEETWAPGIFG